jgi:uncharacterized protein with HEPN domain
MSLEERDLAYLWDMRETAREVLSFLEGVAFTDFQSNKVLRYAVERQLLVIGEAANRVSSELRERHPEIPWRPIIAQRHVLAHEYGEVLVERIWITATKSLPPLIAALEVLLEGQTRE